MTVLASALDHYRRQQRITALGVTAARRVSDSPRRAAAVVTAFQLVAVEEALSAVPRMLAEQRLNPATTEVVDPRSLTGVASDGRGLQSLLEQADSPRMFDVMVATQLQDMSRIASSVGGVTRPAVTGYVRMLNTPSCSRCVVLAGKFYGWNTGFQRHPKCDCRHVPSAENRAGDLRTDPKAYFAGLARTEQDRVFTQAGAQAIRDGADPAQVVNARRGGAGLSTPGGRYTGAEQRLLSGGRDRGALERVDVYGRQVFITREGITVRGVAGRRLGARGPRLMPESIYEHATDRADAVRLLKLHGYLL